MEDDWYTFFVEGVPMTGRDYRQIGGRETFVVPFIDSGCDGVCSCITYKRVEFDKSHLSGLRKIQVR